MSEASAQTSEVLTYEAEIQTAEVKSTYVRTTLQYHSMLSMSTQCLAAVQVQTEEEPAKPFKLVVDNSQVS